MYVYHLMHMYLAFCKNFGRMIIIMVHLVSFPLILSFLFLFRHNLGWSPIQVSFSSSHISFYSSCLLLNHAVILSCLLLSLLLSSHLSSFYPVSSHLLPSCHSFLPIISSHLTWSHLFFCIIWSHHLSSLLISLHLVLSLVIFILGGSGITETLSP